MKFLDAEVGRADHAAAVSVVAYQVKSHLVGAGLRRGLRGVGKIEESLDRQFETLTGHFVAARSSDGDLQGDAFDIVQRLRFDDAADGDLFPGPIEAAIGEQKGIKGGAAALSVVGPANIEAGEIELSGRAFKGDEGGIAGGADHIDGRLLFMVEPLGSGEGGMPLSVGGAGQQRQAVAPLQGDAGTGHRPTAAEGLDEHFVALIGIVLDKQPEVRDQNKAPVFDSIQLALAYFVPTGNLDEECAETFLAFGEMSAQVDGGIIGLLGGERFELDHLFGVFDDIVLIETVIGEVRILQIAAGLADQMLQLSWQKFADAYLKGFQTAGHKSQAMGSGQRQQGSVGGDLDFPGVVGSLHQGVVERFMHKMPERGQPRLQAYIQGAMRRHIEGNVKFAGKAMFRFEGRNLQRRGHAQDGVGHFPGAAPVSAVAVRVFVRQQPHLHFVLQFGFGDVVGKAQGENLARFLLRVADDGGGDTFDLKETETVGDQQLLRDLSIRVSAVGGRSDASVDGQLQEIGMFRQLQRHAVDIGFAPVFIVADGKAYLLRRGFDLLVGRTHRHGQVLFQALGSYGVGKSQSGNGFADLTVLGVLVKYQIVEVDAERRRFEGVVEAGKACFRGKKLFVETQMEAGAGRPFPVGDEDQGPIPFPAPGAVHLRFETDAAVNLLIYQVESRHRRRGIGRFLFRPKVFEVVAEGDPQRIGAGLFDVGGNPRSLDLRRQTQGTGHLPVVPIAAGRGEDQQQRDSPAAPEPSGLFPAHVLQRPCPGRRRPGKRSGKFTQNGTGGTEQSLHIPILVEK